MRTSLRTRFLAAITAGSALASVSTGSGGCGGSVEGVPDASAGTTTASSSSSSSSSSGGASSGNVETAPPPDVDASLPPTPPPTTCTQGKPEQACYTHEQLEYQWYNRRGWGGEADAGPPLPPQWLANGCLAAEDVQDGCCNVAVSGPTLTANGTCCYVHCTGGCCGRPFMIDGEARVAAVIDRKDWMSATGGPEPRDAVEALEPRVRERLGRAWTNDAAMEHASVAAFARFTLDLLAMGAPAELLVDAQAATKDEIEHARGCYVMASHYLGRPLGPGALDVDGSSGARSVAEIAAATVIEGCIGETLSAALAEERARGAATPYARAVLERIAQDEAEHAELAWRFVAWAIGAFGENVRAAVIRALDEAFRHPPVAFDAALASVDPATVRAHGLLDERTAHAVVARTLRDVVAPVAASLTTSRRAA